MEKSDLQVLDLYCGPGGLGTGFSKRFNVVHAVDYNKDACATYQTNHRETSVKNMPITDFIENCIPKDYEGFLYSGIIGGPPCQEFSILNQHKDYGSKRANQLFVMLDVIKYLKPKFVFLENVASIPKKFKETAIKRLKNQNYHVSSKVVLAYNYGSVQKRRRWILTACKRRSLYPNAIPGTRQAKEILLPGEISESKMSEGIQKQLGDLPTGKWVALPGKKWKEYYIVDPHKPLPAVVNVLKNRLVRPNRDGYLSFREVGMAQGFPKDYSFIGTKSSIAQQLANAIPVELASTFANEFFQYFNPSKSKLTSYF